MQINKIAIVIYQHCEHEFKINKFAVVWLIPRDRLFLSPHSTETRLLGAGL
jgi:hypothetical protein